VKLRSFKSAKLMAALAIAVLATAALASGAPLAAGAGTPLGVVVPKQPIASATLTECVTSVNQEERSATFAGEMRVLPGTARMAIRIEVEEKPPREELFHTVSAPGIGAWQMSGLHPKPSVFKYLKQVTDLPAPGRYRASVRFRWLNAHGVTIRRAERTTHVCAQPASPKAPGLTPLA
jgi:hypothetical protein